MPPTKEPEYLWILQENAAHCLSNTEFPAQTTPLQVARWSSQCCPISNKDIKAFTV
jgi:hypothetical protein